MSHSFKKLYSTKVKVDRLYHIPMTKWRSKQTGMVVYYAKTDDPLVTGYVSIPTKAYDDNGEPHCLEHLIFLGSKKYPYKGLLDRVVLRSLTAPLNAKTDHDHTLYVLNAPGTHVFLALFPILLDHIFFPMLNESAYITEIHHITANGEDGGVVYAEMQEKESMCSYIMNMAKLQCMYPNRCAYRFNTGAKLQNLRDKTTIQSIRNYHEKFYRPDNAFLIVTGDISEHSVLHAISLLDDKLQPLISREFLRPWQGDMEVIEPLSLNEPYMVEYPADTEELGHVHIAWRGPSATDYYKLCCSSILLCYLVSNHSPIHRKFVDELSLCTQIASSMDETTESCLTLKFDSVPVHQLEVIGLLLENELVAISDGRVIDMHRMRRIIARQRLQTVSQMYNKFDQELATMCVGDALFGVTQRDFVERMNPIKTYDNMESENKDFWVQLLRDILVWPRKIVIIGQPSKRRMEARGIEEKERVKNRVQSLGPDGLMDLGAKLADAVLENQKPPPMDVIASIPVPDVEQMKFRNNYYTTISNYDSNYDKHLNGSNDRFSLQNITFRFQLDNVRRNNVIARALINTSGLSERLRLYLPLVAELFFELPIKRGNLIIPYETMIAKLDDETITYGSSLGLQGKYETHFKCGKQPQNLVLIIDVERNRYETGVRWLEELLCYTMFCPKRIKVCTDKLLGKINDLLCDGMYLMNAVINDMLFVPKCNHYATTIFRQQTFLRQLLRRLSSAPYEVISDLTAIRAQLITRPNISIHMVADVEQLANEREERPEKPWEEFIVPVPESRPRQVETLPCWKYVKPLHELSHRHCILGAAAIESSYLVQVTKSINDFHHPDLPALKVFIQYLSQEDGPISSVLRGQGLSYHFTMRLEPENGKLCLEIYPAVNIVESFVKARQIILNYCTGVCELSSLELECALVTLMYEDMQRKKYVGTDKLLSSYRKVSPQYNRQMLQKIAHTTIPAMKKTAHEFIKPLFDTKKCRSAIVCHPSKVDCIMTSFDNMGYKYYRIRNHADNFLNNLSPY